MEMDVKKWRMLSREMAIEAMAIEHTTSYLEYKDARARAERLIINRNTEALAVQKHMGQALIALEKMGYDVSYL